MYNSTAYSSAEGNKYTKPRTSRQGYATGKKKTTS